MQNLHFSKKWNYVNSYYQVGWNVLWSLQGRFKGTVMQIDWNVIAHVFQKHPENFAFQLIIILQ